MAKQVDLAARRVGDVFGDLDKGIGAVDNYVNNAQNNLKKIVNYGSIGAGALGMGYLAKKILEEKSEHNRIKEEALKAEKNYYDQRLKRLQYGRDKYASIINKINPFRSKEVDEMADNINNFFSTKDKFRDTLIDANKTLKDHSRQIGIGTAIGTAGIGAGLGYKKYSDMKRKKLEDEKNKMKTEYYKELLNRMTYGPPKTKVAFDVKKVLKGANPKNWSQDTKDTIKNMGATVGVSLGTAGAISAGNSLMNAMQKKLTQREKKHWNEFIKKYPEYEDKTDNNGIPVKDYFKVMMETNPSMAKHPVAVKSFMDRTYDFDQADLNFLNTASRLENDMLNRDNKSKERMTNAVSGALKNMQSDFNQHLKRQEEIEQQRPLTQAKLEGERLNNHLKRVKLQNEDIRDPETGEKHPYATSEIINRISEGQSASIGDLSEKELARAIRGNIRGTKSSPQFVNRARNAFDNQIEYENNLRNALVNRARKNMQRTGLSGKDLDDAIEKFKKQNGI